MRINIFHFTFLTKVSKNLSLLIFIFISGCSTKSTELALTSTLNELNQLPIDVYILAGQSNMVGQGLIKQAPPGYYPLAKNISLHSFSSNFDKQKYKQFKQHGGQAEQQSFLKSITNRYGPELGFAKVLAETEPQQQVIIIKWAVGGTNQSQWAENWQPPGYDRPGSRNYLIGSLFAQTMLDIEKITKAKNVNFRGLLWLQGENDSIRKTSAQQYSQNMKALITSFRRQLKAPNLKVLIGKVDPVSEKHRFVSIVQQQMDQVAADDSLVGVVSAQGISKLADQVHYDGAGLIELGERFGNAWIALDKINSKQ